jgi:hypothetical protein
MKEKFAQIAVGENRYYRVGRFSPEIGSFILFKLIGSSIRRTTESMGDAPAPVADTPPPALNPDLTPEQKSEQAEANLRGLIGAAFLLGAFTIPDTQMIMRECLKVCSRLEGPDGGQPIAICTANGKMLPDIADDLELIMKLQVETMVFNFTDFFAGGGLATVAGGSPRS